MHAIILVGGLGTRMRPLTYDTPKPLLPILGRPLLEWTLLHLARHGVTDATLALGYLPDPFLAAYPDNTFAGVTLHYAVEPEPLDTGGAIRFAAKYSDISDTFVVLNGDMLSDLDITALVDFHRTAGATATIALQEVEDPSAFGIVTTDQSGKVTGFVEKPLREEAPSNLASTGIYVFSQDILDEIPSGRVSLERVVFPTLVATKELYATVASHPASDAGTPEGFLRGHFDLLDSNRAVDLHQLATRVDGHWQEDRATVRGCADKNSYISNGALIEDGATVTHSMIGRNCIIGAGALVVDSVLLDNVVVAPRAVVAHSIIGPAACIGAGAHVTDLSVIRGAEVLAGRTELHGAR
jgi:mannose-1-phosphate guanylyltransferase